MTETAYLDPRTGRTYPLATPRWCGDDRAPLLLTPLPGITRDAIRTEERSLWRYGAAFPFVPEDPISMGEGCTPLVPRVIGGASAIRKSFQSGLSSTQLQPSRPASKPGFASRFSAVSGALPEGPQLAPRAAARSNARSDRRRAAGRATRQILPRGRRADDRIRVPIRIYLTGDFRGFTLRWPARLSGEPRQCRSPT